MKTVDGFTEQASAALQIVSICGSKKGEILTFEKQELKPPGLRIPLWQRPRCKCAS